MITIERERATRTALPGAADPVILRPRPSLPIVARHPVEIDRAQRRRLAALAGRLLADEPTLGATEPFGAGVTPGLGPWPALLLEDHSAISLFDRDGDAAYGHRALLLAGDGDRVIVGAKRSRGFEDYCRDTLGLGRVQVTTLPPEPGITPLALRCARDPCLVARCAEWARTCGGLNVIPYMGHGGIWRLAGAIADRAGAPVRVAAPPPRLTYRVNDKLWFAQRVAELFDHRALPPVYAAFGLAALVGRMRHLAKHHAAVAVKLPDSASAAGNVVFESGDLNLAVGRLRRKVHRLLNAAGWGGGFPLLVTAWERPVIASPSVQLWIPGPDAGEVVVESIFDQTVAGTTAVFCGAESTGLSPRWQARMAREAARLGILFRQLGYFGRCSFDAILVGDGDRDAVLHWVECNGRWGGTSIPMTLANRLAGDGQDHPFVVADRAGLDGPAQDLSAILDRLGSHLYRPGRRPGGAVILSPGRLERGSGFEIMVLGECLATARSEAQAVVELLKVGS